MVNSKLTTDHAMLEMNYALPLMCVDYTRLLKKQAQMKDIELSRNIAELNIKEGQ